MKKLKTADELEQFRARILSQYDTKKQWISICSGTGCHAYRCEDVASALKAEIKRQGLSDEVELKMTGCHGFCERGPLMVLYPQKIFYQQVTPNDVPEIISETVLKGNIINRLLYVDLLSGKKVYFEGDVPFYKGQRRLVFGNNGIIDPANIEDYLAIGGYSALSKVLFNIQPEGVIEEVRKSGLRGRGGGGFPTARKWESCRNAPSSNGTRYVICNADEGDPGAYMDRSLLEGNPHSVIEGMVIGAYAIGSHEGYVYVRHEYPLAVENLEVAIQQAEEYGFLGENILGSGFDFRVVVHLGAGAFVSGESSALMTALEGRVGEPRPKYIRTAVRGIWGKPSNLNNVETWANVPLIINKGADWFTSIGTEESKGTKIFSLVGKVNNTGLVEVPMGTSLRDIIYKIGEGIPEGKKFKAIQTGGPSGGVIPEQFIDTLVDFDELTKLGSMMGSGGMIVMDENTCMVNIAKYFLDFLADESCGKCVPCREGIKRMREILTDITEGKGREGDIKLLEEIAEVTRDASFCALGRTAPNPVLSTIRYFRDEYEAHIKEKRCPAYVCRELISYYIDPDKCKACMICLRNCPVEAITGGKRQVHVINQEKCIKCRICFEVCPPRFGAVERISGEPFPALTTQQARVMTRGSEEE